MGLDSRINLLVASLDLELVRLLRGAIRTADLSAGAGGRGLPASGLAPSPEPRRHIHPEPVVEPRRHLHPEPRFEPRPVIHPTPRIEQQLNDAASRCPSAASYEAIPAPHRLPSPIQPPWKVLPWQNPPQPAPKIKLILRRPDIVRRGQLIDFFI